MAAVHGGDGGNDPPNWGWNPQWGCKRSGGNSSGRAAAANKELEREFQKSGRRITLRLDTAESRWQTIGDTSKWYKSYLGTYVATVPHTYDSWDQVPPHIRDGLIPWLQRRFYLDPYLNNEAGHPLRVAIENMIRQDALKNYRDKKSKFKGKWFSDRGGLDRLGEFEGVPPHGMPQDVWRDLLHYWTREHRMLVAQRNANNRHGQDNLVSTHGRQSYAQREYEYAGQLPVS